MALFDQSARTYDEWCLTPVGSFVDNLEKQLMKEAARPREGEKALDTGCGTGAYTYWLAKQGLDVTGVDLSREMLHVAEEKAGDVKPVFVQGDIHQLPFTDGTFDLVLANITLEFVSDARKAAAEAIRVLKPDGRLVCGFIGKDSSWGRMYKERGESHPGSVFRNAVFYTIEEASRLIDGYSPSLVKTGLYTALNEFESAEEAAKIEMERKKNFPENEAGYFVVRWDKK